MSARTWTWTALASCILVTVLLADQARAVDAFESITPPRPLVYLVAPSHSYAKAWDPLIAETALRLTSIDLAARYGIYAPCWPIDQLSQLPQDGVPRLTFSAKHIPATRHLRMRRHGNLFSLDAVGTEFGDVTLCEREIALPAHALVGICVNNPFNSERPRRVATSVDKVALNGEPFTDYRITDLGDHYLASTVAPQGNGLKVSVFTAQRRDASPTNLAFVYKEVDGDFVIEAQFNAANDPYFWGDHYQFMGIMCRSSLDWEARYALLNWVSTSGFERDKRSIVNQVLLSIPGSQHYEEVADLWSHVLEARLGLPSGDKKIMARERVTCMTWNDLTESTDRLAASMEAGLIRELGVKGQPVSAAPATEDQIDTLNRARNDGLEVKARTIWGASHLVDSVLNKTPTCPEAHYTAAFLGSMLSVQELSGCFHLRSRYLAGPLAHWLFARRLAPAKRTEDILSGAWVALVTGYPESGRRMLQGLPDAAQEAPEAKAIEMYATRDYRPLTAQTVVNVTHIEQIAWIWAAFLCSRYDLAVEPANALAEKRENAALLPLDVSSGMGSYSPELAANLCYAADAPMLLSEERIPAADRQAAAKEIADAFGLPAGAPPAETAFGVRRLAGKAGVPQEHFVQAIAGLMDLYAAAMTQPAGSVISTNGLRWQTVSLHDLAQAQRGLMLIALFRQEEWWAKSLGAPEGATDIAKRLAEGTASVAGAREFFHGFAAICPDVNTLEPAKEDVRKFDNTLLSESAATANLIVHWGGTNRALGKEMTWSNGRGAWDWDSIACQSVEAVPAQAGEAILSVALAEDPCDNVSLVAWIDPKDGEAAVMSLVNRVPYDMAVLRNAYSKSYSDELYDLAAKIAQREIEVTPEKAEAYMDLMNVYYAEDKLAEAVQIGEQAVRHCSYSVSLSTLEGWMAMFLVSLHRNEEALKWGEQAAQSGSETGLMGYARALEAGGRTKEAGQICRDNADRYDDGLLEYAAFMARTRAPADEFIREVNRVANEHLLGRGEEARSYMLEDAELAFVQNPGDPDMLEKLYASPGYPARTDLLKARRLFLTCVLSKRADRAFAYFDRINLAGERTASQLILLNYGMAKRVGRKDIMDKMTPLLAQSDVMSSSMATCGKYLLGQMNEADLLQVARDSTASAFAQWLIGEDAEMKGDLAKALACYKKAQKADCQVTYVAEWWGKDIDKKLVLKPTEKPNAAAPAPTAAKPAIP